MPNVEPTPFSMHIERAAASLDVQVRDALGPLGLSDSPHTWSDQLDRISFEIYRSAVRGTKVTIRAVSQEFRGMDRTRRLLDGARDTITRIDILRSMVDAVGVLALPGVGATEISSDRLHRLHGHIPTLRDAVGSTISHLSRWQDEFGAYQDVFSILELLAETLECLLVSLSATIPDAQVVRGRMVMQRLVALWNERRVIVERAIHLVGSEDEAHHLVARLDDQRQIQDAVVESFSALLEQLHDAPSTPICFLGQEFPVCRFLCAGYTFTCLRSQQLDISQDISRLERVLDRFMDVVEA